MILARAKLNLYLHITGKRADGYHELESLVVFTDLADQLHIAAASELTLRIEGAFAAGLSTSDNLVLHAARALQRHTGTKQGAAITLEKHIPVGAGLGGGSADAAAALLALNAHWGLGVPAHELAVIGKTLGADVPMCLHSQAVVARGVGEQLTPLPQPLPALHGVLLYPNQPLATAQVYGAFRPQTKVAATALPPAEAKPFMEWLATTRNDLQAPAITLMPEIAEMLLVLETSPYVRLARMTGSGSCCFALTETADDAAKLITDLRATYSKWWCTNFRSA